MQPYGSPARAGIDPRMAPATGPSSRFPRTRGDRPMADIIAVCNQKVPPHARG